MKKTLLKLFENVYWVSGEDKNYEVLECVVFDNLGNGMYEILYNTTVYEVEQHRLFKPECKEDAIEFANDLINGALMNYRTWIADDGLAAHREHFESAMAELRLVQEKNNRL